VVFELTVPSRTGAAPFTLDSINHSDSSVELSFQLMKIEAPPEALPTPTAKQLVGATGAAPALMDNPKSPPQSHNPKHLFASEIIKVNEKQ
jgi:hypothetical protein